MAQTTSDGYLPPPVFAAPATPSAAAPALPARPADVAPAITVSSVVAATARDLLKARRELWARMDAIAQARDRVARVARRAGHGSQGPVEVTLPDLTDPYGDLPAMADVLEQCEQRLKLLSATVSQLQAPRGRITKRQQQLFDEASGELDAARVYARQLAAIGDYTVSEARTQVEAQLAANAERLRESADALRRTELSAWDVARWADWSPVAPGEPTEMRVGAWFEARSESTLGVPLVVPFVAGGRALELRSRGEEQHAIAHDLLQSIVTRSVGLLHGRATVVLLDPAGEGLSFPVARALGLAVGGADDARVALREVKAHAARVAATYLAHESTTFADLPLELRLAERQRVVVAAGFPVGYDASMVAMLEELADTGGRAGVHVVLHRNLDEGDVPDVSGRVVVDLGERAVTVDGIAGEVAFDSAPPHALPDLIGRKLRATPPVEQVLPWDEVPGHAPAQWWTKTADAAVSVTIGRSTTTEPLQLHFGSVPTFPWPYDHAAIAAKPGSGRSSLVHDIVMSAAVGYAPDDLRMVLVDGPRSAEFAAYQQLPHAEIVSVRTPPAQVSGLLADLVREVERRHELFARFDVRDLHGLRARHQAFRRRNLREGVPARLLVIVKDIDRALAEDAEGEMSDSLLALARRGGTAGVHLLFVGRSFKCAGLVHRSDVMAAVQQRVALALEPEVLSATTELGIDGRALVTSCCDRPGRVVVNDRSGDDDGNHAGRVALLAPADRDRLVEQLATKARRDLAGRFTAYTQVLNGYAAPEVLDNTHVHELLRNDVWDAPDFLQEWARAPMSAGGLGVADWAMADRPLPLFVGQETGARSHAFAVLRRRPAENVLVLGRDEDARLGMATTALVSAALVEGPKALRVWISDHAVSDGEEQAVLAHAAALLRGIGVPVREGGDDARVAALLGDAVAEVQRRRDAGTDRAAAHPTLLLVLNEPDRVLGLSRVPVGEGLDDSPLGAQLHEVLVHGPAVGVHVVLVSESLNMVRSVLADRVLQRAVRHRVVMKASEDDSYVLVRSARAAALNAGGDRPVQALLFDGDRQTMVSFRPYTTGATDDALIEAPRHGPFFVQLATIAQRLAERTR